VFQLYAKCLFAPQLVTWPYSLKNQVGDKDKLGAKLSPEDKKAILEAVSWMDTNKDASVGDFAAQKKQLEAVAQPIISKMYAGQAPPTAG